MSYGTLYKLLWFITKNKFFRDKPKNTQLKGVVVVFQLKKMEVKQWNEQKNSVNQLKEKKFKNSC